MQSVTICGSRIESAESAIVKRARAAVHAAMATNDALAVPAWHAARPLATENK